MRCFTEVSFIIIIFALYFDTTPQSCLIAVIVMDYNCSGSKAATVDLAILPQWVAEQYGSRRAEVLPQRTFTDFKQWRAHSFVFKAP